jgi:hypothetical protein
VSSASVGLVRVFLPLTGSHPTDQHTIPSHPVNQPAPSRRNLLVAERYVYFPTFRTKGRGSLMEMGRCGGHLMDGDLNPAI